MHRQIGPVMLRTVPRTLPIIPRRMLCHNGGHKFIVRPPRLSDYDAVKTLSRTVFGDRYPQDWLCGSFVQLVKDTRVQASVIVEIETDEIVSRKQRPLYR